MASADSGQQPPAEWHVESHSAWIAPASKLEMRVPVIDNARFLYLDFEVLQGRWINFDVWLERAWLHRTILNAARWFFFSVDVRLVRRSR